MQVCEKVGKSRFTVFFQWFGAPEPAKAAGAEPAGQMRDEKLHAVLARSTLHKSKCTRHTNLGPLLEVEMSKKCTPLWREAHFQVKMCKTRQVRTTFGSWDIKKVHAVVARSTFPSQNVQNTPGSDHFWKLRCRARRRRRWRRRRRQQQHHHHHQQQQQLQQQQQQQLQLQLLQLQLLQLQLQLQLQQQQRQQQQLLLLLLLLLLLQHQLLQQLQLQLQQLKQLQLHNNYNYNYNYNVTIQLQLQLRYNYTTLHYTTLNDTTLTTTTTTTTTTLLYTTLHYTKRHYTNYNYSHNYNYATLHYTTLHYTTQDFTTLHHPAFHYTRPITPLQYDCNYTTRITLHDNYNSTTLQLRLQLQYTTLHPAVVGEVTTATIAATPTNTTPTTFRSISGFALPSVIHNSQPLLYIGFLFWNFRHRLVRYYW